MTTTALTAAPTALRPVPWRRLGWVAWRRYRPTLLALLAFLAVLAGALLLRGHQMREAYAAVQACTPSGSVTCIMLEGTFRDTYNNNGPIGAFFVWVPAIIGAFAGAPLLARELETGMFRFTWTKGAGRTRWMIGLTVAGLAAVAVLAAVFGVLVSWFQDPLFGSGLVQRLRGNVFAVTGIAVIGWALLAFTLGVFLGLLTRRVLPALALTLATWTGLAFLTSVLRDNYQAPLLTSNTQLGPTDFFVDQLWVKDGIPATTSQINQVLQNIGMQSGGGGTFQPLPGASAIDPVPYLTQHGFNLMTSYLPDSRYWPFQWIEFGWLAALSLLLIGLSIWLLHRRSA